MKAVYGKRERKVRKGESREREREPKLIKFTSTTDSGFCLMCHRSSSEDIGHQTFEQPSRLQNLSVCGEIKERHDK